jgi:hypothetical protein
MERNKANTIKIAAIAEANIERPTFWPTSEQLKCHPDPHPAVTRW